MDANQLLFYLRGFFEHVVEPTPDQLRALRTEVLSAKPIKPELIPVNYQPGAPGDCGCKH